MARKPEQALWDHVDRVMGSAWRAQRHEDRYSSDIPDVSYSCRGVSGWIELKVIERWPHIGMPFNIPPSYFTPGQRGWLTTHGKRGNSHCYVLARVERDFLLLRWDQIPKLGEWTRDDWLWGAWGFWQRRLLASGLAERLGATEPRGGGVR